MIFNLTLNTKHLTLLNSPALDGEFRLHSGIEKLLKKGYNLDIMSPRKPLKKADGKTKLAAVKELMREFYNAGYSKEVFHTMVQFLELVIRSTSREEKQLKEEIKLWVRRV